MPGIGGKPDASRNRSGWLSDLPPTSNELPVWLVQSTAWLPPTLPEGLFGSGILSPLVSPCLTHEGTVAGVPDRVPLLPAMQGDKNSCKGMPGVKC